MKCIIPGRVISDRTAIRRYTGRRISEKTDNGLKEGYTFEKRTGKKEGEKIVCLRCLMRDPAGCCAGGDRMQSGADHSGGSEQGRKNGCLWKDGRWNRRGDGVDRKNCRGNRRGDSRDRRNCFRDCCHRRDSRRGVFEAGRGKGL